MKRKWVLVFFVSIVMLLITGCNQSVEEQVSAGLENAKTTFESKPNEPNKMIGHIELYIPKGYGIEKGIDELNYTIVNGEDSYILFVNPHEPGDSQLHHTILKEEPNIEIVQEKIYKADEVFGFSTVIRRDENQYELVVSIGGVKLTTLSNNKKIDQKLQEMMEIVQTVRTID
ncbi:hypothetical protein CSE16_16210 [Solibacillus sp. R5-41]|uniref:hypothetical protein n=1 Tax=Solibacillus sp. R5-41 TaxID=2048654 RepID=UPI000C12463E|nr:hypothetical protein [Solibacillus sp. R5-41]ATP41483.1 hypothetical protein CSE16_16210 [Solibacillus sp. R5-41]